MEINYPLSVIFTWNPNISSFNSLKECCDNIKRYSSCYGIKWEVIITLKTYKNIQQPQQQLQQQQNQQQNPQSLNQQQQNQREIKKGKEQRTGVIFIQYDDSNIRCVINKKELNQCNVDDVIIADKNIENLLTGFAGLSLRATRTIQGFRYNLGNFIVSIGIMDNGPLAGIVILELSYIGCELDSTSALSELHSLAENLIPLTDRNSSSFNLKSYIRQVDIERPFCFSDRVLLWVDSLQLSQS